jgi:formylglycine-generating enzyme required for sulfatase activity
VSERALITRGLALAEYIGKKEYICPIIGAKFVLIPAGTFMMGSPEDEPLRHANETLHQVTISKPFYMQTTPVTQGQWTQVMGENPSYFKGDDNLPVEQVSWNDTQDFIERLNRQEGTDKYRLPTEAEWEYSCRAGSRTAFCFGSSEDDLREYAWYQDNSGVKTHSVGKKQPNSWGLYDMHGNVFEWVQDWYGEKFYAESAKDNPGGPASGQSRVTRGGCWFLSPVVVRAAYRLGARPAQLSYVIGFRLSFSAP